ncbi:MAG: M56 family metallopeptidase, partial [Gimesia sp.]
MPSEFLTTTIVTVLDMLTTYLLHSTLLLTMAALVTWCYRRQSHALTERLWKSAAVIPLLTVPLQLLCGVGNSVFTPRWSEPVVEVVALVQSDLPVPEINVADDSKPIPGPLETVDEPLGVEIDIFSITPSPSLEPVGASYIPLPIEAPVSEQIVLTPVPDTSETSFALPVPAVTPLVTTHPSIVTTPILPEFARWLAVLVVAFVTAGLLQFFIAGRRFRRRIQKFRAVEGGCVSDTLTRVVRRASIRRRVRLLESGDISEPIAFGIWHWTIVVPQGIETRLDRNELEALLAHELAHLVRGDTWW